jgi:hypothetical protein
MRKRAYDLPKAQNGYRHLQRSPGHRKIDAGDTRVTMPFHRSDEIPANGSNHFQDLVLERVEPDKIKFAIHYLIRSGTFFGSQAVRKS